MEDVEEANALMGATYDYPPTTAAPPPTPAMSPEALAAAPIYEPPSASVKVTREGSARVLDLFERAASPIGAVERADAALAAARAIASPGIIKVQPGSTVTRSKPVGDASEREAAESAVSAESAVINFAKPLAARRAEEAARNRAAAEASPDARLRAVNAYNSEDAEARRKMVDAERARTAARYKNASSFYGGRGIENARPEDALDEALGGSASAAAEGGARVGPASDFWEWSPPENPNRVAPDAFGSSGSPYGSRGAGSPYGRDESGGIPAPPAAPRRKKIAPAYTRREATPSRVEAAVEVMERGPEKTLELQFQSVVETQNAVLPAFESDVSVRATETAAAPAAEVSFSAAAASSPAAPAAAPAATVASAPAVEASLEDALASPVRELGAADGAKEGVLSSGARWWREEGREYLEEGKVMRWTVIRGASADGSVEWEEKFWETSDPYTYRELGAVKSGRDSDGQAWQESWKEMYQHDVNGTPFIHREASKWSHTPKGQCWSEGWTEDYRADGSVDRYCEKTGSLEDGAAPEDGHANRWTEKWGEKWNGVGGCIKWTDTWASRDHAEGGAANAPGRSWGEKWEEKWGFSYNDEGRAGTRQGVTWDELGGAHTQKTWGEEHYPDGRMHKYGNSSDGSQYWDEWQDGDGGWWERMPSFGWHEAIGHSPYLMEVPLQPRTGGGAGAAKGKGGSSIITPHRGSRRRVE